ncbi:MAG TPA: hypothetical protein VGX25_05780 [Actinophytocola sp.]|uniref:hypothetical protein n=1 Tax=Actinophytocola sp. TaxID=1872138 RepID=UPI002DDD3DDF|nr:hypothetical protein [Actinophytocola sp.]HEV2778894.1 hypothetical protein [Actinophytocola sp.]
MTDPDRDRTAAEPEREPDFAEEHTRPTFADEPSTEDPDESVPTGRGGDGGMESDRPV